MQTGSVGAKNERSFQDDLLLPVSEATPVACLSNHVNQKFAT